MIKEKYRILILIFLGNLLILNCDKNTVGTESDIPESPIFVEKSADDAEQETGIDAIPEANAIYLEWHPLTDDRIQWIKIYRSSEGEKTFRFLTSVSNEENNFIDYQVNLEIRYHYFLKSVTRNKIESLPSDTMQYMLYPKPVDLNHTLEKNPGFSWQYPSIPPVGYLLKLVNSETMEAIWISHITNYDPVVEVRYNWDGNAVLDSLDQSQHLKWRVDVIGVDPYSGSESVWKAFEWN